MNPFKRHASVEIAVVSGTLRVTVRPSPHWLLLLFQAGIIAMFAVLSLRSWVKMPLLERILITIAVIGAIAGWFEQPFGFSEEIEVDPKNIQVRKATVGWERTREYPIERCTDLKLQDESGDPPRVAMQVWPFEDYRVWRLPLATTSNRSSHRIGGWIAGGRAKATSFGRHH
jgi:hypothetical protein